MRLSSIFISLLLLGTGAATAQSQYQGCPSRPDDSYAATTKGAPATKEEIATEIKTAFPAAASTKKEQKWTTVYDGKAALLGYAVYSKPASNGITGFAGETPLLIAFSAEWKVLSVQLLENEESHFIVDKVLQSPLLQSWNGLDRKAAQKKRVDAVSGATYTSNAITQSFRAALKKLNK